MARDFSHSPAIFVLVIDILCCYHCSPPLGLGCPTPRGEICRESELGRVQGEDECLYSVVSSEIDSTYPKNSYTFFMQKRTIFIGDVHGCYDELMTLCEKI